MRGRLVTGLLAAVVVLQLVGIVLGPVFSGGTQCIPQFCRLPGSFLLVVTALVLWAQAPQRLKGIAGLVAGGMLFGHLGDLAMGRVIPTPQPWLAGMVLFGIGHGLYAAAFVRLGRGTGQWRWRGGLAAGLLLSLGVTAALVAVSDEALVLRLGGLAYGAVIGAMLGLALALTQADRRFGWLLAGALLFWLSDVMLGASLFGPLHGSLWNDAIWVIYLTGQGLIVWAAGKGRLVAGQRRTGQ